jgi:hypothetical protein
MERLATTATVRFAALVQIVPARVDPLPSIGRPYPAPAAIVIRVSIERPAEGNEAVVAKEAVMVEAMLAVESGAGKSRPECRCAHETRTTDMRTAEMSAAADGGKGHPATAHSTAKTSAVHSAGKTTTVHAAAKTTTVSAAAMSTAATTTTASGESRRRKRNTGADHRRHETREEFVCHRLILRH